MAMNSRVELESAIYLGRVCLDNIDPIDPGCGNPPDESAGSNFNGSDPDDLGTNQSEIRDGQSDTEGEPAQHRRIAGSGNHGISAAQSGFQSYRRMDFRFPRKTEVFRPLSGVVDTPGISYLHEREHKRELRRDQAKESTAIAESTYLDQERNLVFNLRNAFVQALQAKAVLAERARKIWSTGIGSWK